MAGGLDVDSNERLSGRPRFEHDEVVVYFSRLRPALVGKERLDGQRSVLDVNASVPHVHDAHHHSRYVLSILEYS